MRVYVALSPQPVAKNDGSTMTVMDMYGILPVYITEAGAKAAHPNAQILSADAADNWHPLFVQSEQPESAPEADISSEQSETVENSTDDG